MARIKRTKITINTSELVRIRYTGGTAEALCPECCRTVQMMRPSQAASVTGMSARAIYRLAESGEVHFLETSQGILLICLESLARLEQSCRQLLLDISETDSPGETSGDS